MRPTAQSPTLGKRSPMDQLRQEIAGYLSVGRLSRMPHAVAGGAGEVEAIDRDRATNVVKLQEPDEPRSIGHAHEPAAIAGARRRAERRGETRPPCVLRAGQGLSRSGRMPRISPARSRRSMLAGVAGGEMNESDWTGRNAPDQLLRCERRDRRSAGHRRRARTLCFHPADRVGFAKGATASIHVGLDRDSVYIGEIDGKVIDLGKTPFKLFGFEINLAELLKTHASVSAYRQLSRTPASCAIWRSS